jgi:hypothetical protein
MSTLSDEQKALAIELAIKGVSIQKIREAIKVDSRFFWEARVQDLAFDIEFNRARQEGLEELADGLLEMNEQYGDVQKARLQSDNVKFLLSKRKPHIYGDRIDLNVNQTVDIGAAMKEAMARVLPSGDPNNGGETQMIDITEIKMVSAPDNKSDVQEMTPLKNSSDDIFD